MGRSAPLFNKILETNQLIKGRLNVNNSDLKKLYMALHKDDQHLRNKQSYHDKMIKNQISKRNAVKLERKRIHESLQKSFDPTKNKVSLLYKNQGGAYYIKARFYWEGKQREVQVGSIPIIIKMINTMIDNNILLDIKKFKIKKLTWQQITNRPEVIDSIKVIASLKAQEYILHRLLAAKLNVLEKVDDHDGDTIQVGEDKLQLDTADYSTPNDTMSNDELEEDSKGVKWYENWRKENL